MRRDHVDQAITLICMNYHSHTPIVTQYSFHIEAIDAVGLFYNTIHLANTTPPRPDVYPRSSP